MKKGKPTEANPAAEALKMPDAKPPLPISAGKKPFDNAFIAEARKYWSNFHLQLDGEHALYSLTCPSITASALLTSGSLGGHAPEELPLVGAIQAAGCPTRREAAVMAVAHTMLTIGYHMLRTGQSYHELGGDYLERIN